MGRILGIDYGSKRVGLAVTDPLQIIVSGLDTVSNQEALEFVLTYCKSEPVDKIVVGEPMHLDGTPAQIAPQVNAFVKKLRELLPGIEVITHDERFSSEDAKRVILQSGAGRKKRRNKSLVDKISAVLILQDYLQH